MTQGVRKFALTGHIATSVGWLGAVAAFLTLSLYGLYSPEAQVRTSVYVAMGIVTWAAIVPLSAMSVVTGVVQSWITPWGLFRHYWVVAKLAISAVASILLVLHTQPIDAASSAALSASVNALDVRLQVRLVADAAAAAVALTVATALSVYKPAGLTSYGVRMTAVEADTISAASRRWKYVLGLVLLALLLAIVVRHLAGGHGH
jgi:hypothetical protein